MTDDKELINFIKKIIAKAADLPVSKIQINSNFQNDLEIDSLEAVEILHKIEKKYKIKFINFELQEMQTLQDIFNTAKILLNKK